MKPPKEKSALVFILKSLVPYSRESLISGFRPNQFFNELEKISAYKRHTLEVAAQRAIEKGLIEKTRNQQLRLTELGRRTALPYATKRLPKNGQLMIVFDVAETKSIDRQRLRRLLRKWQFKQVQKSVWTSNRDFIEPIKEAVAELGLEDSVELYECARLYPNN